MGSFSSYDFLHTFLCDLKLFFFAIIDNLKWPLLFAHQGPFRDLGIDEDLWFRPQLGLFLILKSLNHMRLKGLAYNWEWS